MKMRPKLKFTDEQMLEIQTAKAKNRDKTIDKRLTALEYIGNGTDRAEIAKITGFSISYIPKLAAKYRKGGIDAIVENHYHGNRRNLSIAEEQALLRPFQERAEAGQMVDVREIKAAYDKAIGHETGHGQIYFLLKRHNWRKIKPRSKHPKKADEETIAASKKLTNV